MLKQGKKLSMDLFDLNGRKVCPLYESTSDVSGQAYNIVMTIERNGWRELSFSIPSTMMEGSDIVANYRIDYLRPEFQVRVIDDEGTDWYIITKPAITHNGAKKTVSVTAGHVCQLLKTKNLSLEFSDDYGNNIGTAKELLDAILDGTGWTAGEVYDFREERTGEVKYRTLKCNAKTGAFKMISTMCDLFEAKPVYHGSTKTVDILPLNPFSDEFETIPDVSTAGTVVELHYSKNLKNVTKTEDSSNLVTKLYAYGSYGDTTSGYCSIQEAHHTEFTITLQDVLDAGEHWFEVVDDSGTTIRRHFYLDVDVPAGSKIIYSLLDPASMSYVWIQSDGGVFPDLHETYWPDISDESWEVLEESGNTNAHAYAVSTGKSGTMVEGQIEKDSVQNYFSYILDFTYYGTVGLFDDSDGQRLACLQRFGRALYEKITEASASYSTSNQDLSETWGDITFNKLAILEAGDEGGYLSLTLDKSEYEDGVIYRTDYDVSENKRWTYVATAELDQYGDPINSGASYLRIVHDTVPVTWTYGYLKAVDDTDDPTVMVFHIKKADYDAAQTDGDKFFITDGNSVNGYLGALESADEAAEESLDTVKIEGSTESNVFFSGADDVSNFPMPVSESTYVEEDVPDWFIIDSYAWLWNYHTDGRESQMFFCWWDHYGENSEQNWQLVHYTNETPANPNQDDYWFNWQSSVLSRYTGEVWTELDSDVEQAVGAKFSTVYNQCMRRDMYYQGYAERYVYISDKKVEAGNYMMPIQSTYYAAFKLENDVPAGNTIAYNTTSGWIEVGSIDEDQQILDGELFSEATRINDVGEEEHDPYYSTSQWISVVSGDTLSLRGLPGSKSFSVKMFYRHFDDEVEKLDYEGSINDVNGADGSFTIPSGINMIRIQGFDQSASFEWSDYVGGTDWFIYKGSVETVSCKTYNYDNVFYHESNCFAQISDQGTISTDDGTVDTTVETSAVTDYVSVIPSTQYSISGMQFNGEDLTYTIHVYNSKKRWISSVEASGDAILTVSDDVFYLRIVSQKDDTAAWYETFNLAVVPNIIIVSIDKDAKVLVGTEYVSYTWLKPTNADGELKGIIPLTQKASELADLTYIVNYQQVIDAQEVLSSFEQILADNLDSRYREGWLQKSDYVDGDEEKLYMDAIDDLKEVSSPEVSYNIGYVNIPSIENLPHVSGIATETEWPEVEITSAIHLVDPETNTNCWAYVDKISRCYDDPKKTQITINTKLTTISQHSFTDVMTNIANVASTIKGKENVIDRASNLNDDGTVDGSNIVGEIDLTKVSLTSGSTSFKTSEDGSFIFESVDGLGAMKLTGTGFQLAKNKDEKGEWIWRSFGDGRGFTADEITAGTIKTDLIQAGSITVDKVASNFASGLDLSSNQYVKMAAKSAETLAGSSIYIGPETITVASGGSLNISADASITFNSQNFNVDEEGNIETTGGLNTAAKSGVSISSAGLLIEGDDTMFHATKEGYLTYLDANGEEQQFDFYHNFKDILALLSN